MFNFSKFSAIVAAFMLTIGTVSAQDIIVLNNNSADEIEAKVVEVSQTEVKYKKWSYQDGPTFTIPASDIFVIKYKNGEKQRFGVEKQEAYQPQTNGAYTPKQVNQDANKNTTFTQGNGDEKSEASHTQPNVSYAPANYTAQSSNASPKFKNEYFEKGFDAYGTVGYILGLDDWWAVPLNLTLGYRFNPYIFVGGTTGAIYNEYATLIPIMSTFRSDLPLGRRSSFFGEVSLGGGIAVDGDGESGFMASVGPGITFGDFSLSVSYLYTGEGSGGIAFKIGWEI